MEEKIAKCGCDCIKCPTYKDNLPDLEMRKKCSAAWNKYLNIRLSPEKLRLCDGCTVPDEHRKVYYLNCRVRKCANTNEVPNCAYCSSYPCEHVSNIHSIQQPDAIKKIEQLIGGPIPKADYLAYIEPFEGIKHLNAIRKTLTSEDIVEIKKFAYVPRVSHFPEDLPFSPQKREAYRSVHKIISDLESAKDVSFAQLEVLKNKRRNIMKILWVMGLKGELRDQTQPYLVVDFKTYAANKLTWHLSKIIEYIKGLKEQGVFCSLRQNDNAVKKITEDIWKKRDWDFALWIDSDIKGIKLQALKNYVKNLDQVYQKNAFRYFSKADMGVLK